MSGAGARAAGDPPRDGTADRAVPRFPAPRDGRLDRDMLDAFARDGCLVLEGFAPPATCATLAARARAIAAEFVAGLAARSDATGGPGSDETPSVFSTRTHRHANDDYFIGSAHRVRCFLEEEGVDASGRPCRAGAGAVNKIGHALHALDPVFGPFSRQPALAVMATALGCREPRLVQSMCILKPPRVGGEVVWHQDGTFLRTEPPSVVGLWLALESATRDNGCLWVLPGAHRGALRARFRRGASGLALETLDDTPWPHALARPLETPRGTLVALHGLLPHRSDANRSARSRIAYSLHYIDGRCRYASDNWIAPATATGGAPA